MAINKEIKRLDKSNVELTITVPKEDIQVHYNDMISEYTKTLQLPGFRKGKVPREVLEMKYAEALKDDAMSRIIDSTLQDVLKDENTSRNERPLPYSAPELQGKPVLNLDQDFQYAVIYDVMPDVNISQWKGLNAEYIYAEIEEGDIDRELQEIRERNAVVMDRDDNDTAVNGDIVTINYKIFDENGEVSKMLDMHRDDFAFTLGSGANAFKFDDDIVGMKRNETKEFEKKFDEGLESIFIAGKTRKMQITLTALKEKKLPDLDDDLAQDVDEKYQTLDDLKKSVKERLEKQLDIRLREKRLSAVLKLIMENTPVVIPESMIKAETESRVRRIARHYGISAENVHKMMAMNGKDNEWRDEARQALHSRIIIETLMEEQKIAVSDEDVEKEFESIASVSGTPIEEVKKHYDDNAVNYIREDIMEKKITDMLLAENNLKPGKKENYLDFMTDNS